MQARIEQDLKAAMKSGDKRRVSTLRLLLSALKNEKINSQRELTAEEAEAIIRRAGKQRRESIEVYERTGRADLAAVIQHKEDQVLFVNLGPAEGRGERVITALGKPYTAVDSPCIIV